MGYNCITFVLSHFLTLKKYKEECLIWCLFPPDIDNPIKCIWVFLLSILIISASKIFARCPKPCFCFFGERSTQVKKIWGIVTLYF